MLKKLKALFSSKLFRLLFSVVLIYFAFRKIDIFTLFNGLKTVPWWFLVLIITYLIMATALGAVRWMYLAIDKPKLVDFRNFLHATFSGTFYSLFFPSAIGGDIVKWLPLIEKYPEISKTKMASSVLIDRIIGLSAFALMAFLSAMAGKLLHFEFPGYLFWLFFLLFAMVIIFYILVFSVDFQKYFGSIVILKKVVEVLAVFRGENKKRIILCLLLSVISEPIWILPNYFYSLIFGSGMSLLSVFVFLPIINLIIVLPISFAGFGARENLFIFFFSQLGLQPEKILLVSTFSGIMNILNALLGGLISLI